LRKLGLKYWPKWGLKTSKGDNHRIFKFTEKITNKALKYFFYL